MRVVWSADARRDLERIHEFLASKSRQAADRATVALARAPGRLAEVPRMGVRVRSFPDAEVRRVVVARQYEMRYQIVGSVIIILRIFHTREDR